MAIGDIDFDRVEYLFNDKIVFVMVWSIFVGIGIISTILGFYLLGKKILDVMSKGVEAAFRNKFPFDYWMNQSWVIQIFEKHDFKEDIYSPIDAGSDCPGVKMVKGGR